MKKATILSLHAFLLISVFAPNEATASNERGHGTLCQILSPKQTPAFSKTNLSLYTNSATYISNAIGLKPASYLITDLDELRYLPFSRSEMTLLAVVSSVAPLNNARLESVVALARHRSITIHVIWRGNSLIEQSIDRKLLQTLTSQTSGKLIDWDSHSTLICGPEIQTVQS